MSLPSRERGLKLASLSADLLMASVAPLAGAWIEINNGEFDDLKEGVAPLAGAWIEIQSVR